MPARSLLLLTFCLLVAGCDPMGGPQPAASAVNAALTEATFLVLDSLLLQDDSIYPIVKISGLDHANGRIVISDPSEADLKVYSERGDLVRVIGRRGSGPGEFQLPIHPRFDERGLIHVVDARLNRVSVFETVGDHLSTLNLTGFARIVDFELALDSFYVVVGQYTENPDASVHILAPDGKVRRSFLDLNRVVPPGQKPEAVWESIRRTSVAVTGDRAYVVNSLIDSLWTIDLRSHTVAAAELPVERPKPLSPPETTPTDRQTLLEWARSLRTAVGVFALPHGILITYAEGGIYNDGHTGDALMLRENKAWMRIASPPPILGIAEDGTLVGLLNPAEFPVLLGTGTISP